MFPIMSVRLSNTEKIFSPLINSLLTSTIGSTIKIATIKIGNAHPDCF